MYALVPLLYGGVDGHYCDGDDCVCIAFSNYPNLHVVNMRSSRDLLMAATSRVPDMTRKNYGLCT